MIPSALVPLRLLNVGSCKIIFYKGNQLLTLSRSLFVILLCPWILYFDLTCLIQDAVGVFIGNLVDCLVANQSVVPNILTTLFPSNMVFNVSICIEGYEC